MGLYLCIFEGDDEIDGVEIGSYADFNAFRDFVVSELETGDAGSRFQTIILHSDCDGEWSVAECNILKHELTEIEAALKVLPPAKFASDWQKNVAKSIGLNPKNAYESFIDVDGEFLIDRLKALADTATKCGSPILFQ